MQKHFHWCGESYLALHAYAWPCAHMAPPIITLPEISRSPWVRTGTTVTHGDSVFVCRDWIIFSLCMMSVCFLHWNWKKGFINRMWSCTNTTFTWLWSSFYTDVENMAADCKQHYFTHKLLTHGSFSLAYLLFFHRGGSHKGERGQRGNICQLHELKSRKLLVSSSGCKQCCSDNKVHFWTTSNCLISSLM